MSATWHDRKGGKRETFTAGNVGGAKKLSRVYGTEADASAAANAAQSRAQREPVSLDLRLALGRPDISPEQKTTVVGYKSEIDAIAWIVGEVSHSISDRGYTTNLKMQVDGQGSLSS